MRIRQSGAGEDVMIIGEYGRVKLRGTGKEMAELIFTGGHHQKLAFAVEDYYPKNLVFKPYEFARQSEAIAEAFGEKDWEVFMTNVQTVLREKGYEIDILGWLETPDGKILKSPGYANPPRPFRMPNIPKIPNAIVEQMRHDHYRDPAFLISWMVVIAMAFAVGVAVYLLWR